MDFSPEQPMLTLEPERRRAASGAFGHASSVMATVLIRLLQIAAALAVWQRS